MAEVELLLELYRAAIGALNRLVANLRHDGEDMKMLREAIATN